MAARELNGRPWPVWKLLQRITSRYLEWRDRSNPLHGRILAEILTPNCNHVTIRYTCRSIAQALTADKTLFMVSLQHAMQTHTATCQIDTASVWSDYRDQRQQGVTMMDR